MDTRTVTLGQAMVVLEAAEVAGATDDLDATEAAARPCRSANPRLRRSRHHGQCPQGWPHRSGEGPYGLAVVDQADHRDPDGVAEAESRQRTRAGSLEYLVNKLRQAGPIDGLAVAHAAAPDLEVFLGMLDGLYPREDILVNYIGPVIGTHAGPRCIGICYRLAETAGG